MKLYYHPVSTTCRPIMLLAAECGSSITLRATGPDEAAAVDALAALVARGFGEA